MTNNTIMYVSSSQRECVQGQNDLQMRWLGNLLLYLVVVSAREDYVDRPHLYQTIGFD